MKEIVKILEEKCDFDNLNIFNCENKIIKPIKRYLEIEWYKYGGQKIAIKFKNNKYVFKIYYEKRYSVCEQELYNFAKTLFNSNFYLPITKISKNYLIFCQNEVKVFDDNLVKEYKEKYNIDQINNEINSILSQIKNLNPLDQDIISSEGLKLWIYLSIQYYGKEQFIKLFNFYNLPFFYQDFDSKNLGITKYGRPVIIDYG